MTYLVMKHLVIGLGEVGAALRDVLDCEGNDPWKGITAMGTECEFMHICIPYDDNFNRTVKEYQERFKPTYTVIHSTVPIGTSSMHGASNSPIRGRHPDMVQSLKTFLKYVGGKDSPAVAQELTKYGIPAVAVVSPEGTEAGKLFDLMQYGAMILLEKEIHAYCASHDLDFSLVYTSFNRSYNAAYTEMGYQEFSRPVLEHMPGKIGGHCVTKMMELLPSATAKRILKENEAL